MTLFLVILSVTLVAVSPAVAQVRSAPVTSSTIDAQDDEQPTV